MTLVVAAPCANFVVVGADSRGTIQDIAGNRSEINIMEKIIEVGTHVVILTYGDSDSSNYLVEKFKDQCNNIDGVTRVAEQFASLCRDEMSKIRSVPHLPNFFPNFGFIIAGLDKVNRKYTRPRCYNLKSITGCMLGRPLPFAIDGKPFIAHYLFAQKFHPNMELDDLCALVAQVIYDTMSIDGDVGGKIKIGVINQTKFRELLYVDVKRSIRQWSHLVI